MYLHYNKFVGCCQIENMTQRLPDNYKHSKKSKAATAGDIFSSPYEMVERLNAYKQQHPEFRESLDRSDSFVRLPTKFIQDRAKLYMKLGSVYTTYLCLRSYINRDDGKKHPADVYDNLHLWYNQSLLVTSLTFDNFRERLGISEFTLAKHLAILEALGFIRKSRVKGKFFKRARKTLIWLGWWTSTYKSSGNKVTEFFFEEEKMDVEQQIAYLGKLKKLTTKEINEENDERG